VSDEGARRVSYHRNCGATCHGKLKQNFDSKPRVSNFHCKESTIFDVGSIRSWSLAVFSSLYYDQTLCYHIFWWGGEGVQLLSGSTCNIHDDGSVADETLEKQTFFFYAIP